MADDAEQSERTERASARRLRMARENGDIAVSRDLGMLAALGGGGGVLVTLASGLRDALVMTVSASAENLPDPSLARLLPPLTRLALLALTVTGAATLAVAVVYAVQTRMGLWPERTFPDFSRVFSAGRMKQLFKKDVFVNLGVALVKVLALGLTLWSSFGDTFMSLPRMLGLSTFSKFGLSCGLAISMAAAASAQPKIAQCFKVYDLLKMDQDHYWANWQNACPYTIDSVYVMVRFSDRSRGQLGNGVWALHFVTPGTHQVTRFTAPRGVPDFDFVRLHKITTDSLEALLDEPGDRIHKVSAEARRTGDPGAWQVAKETQPQSQPETLAVALAGPRLIGEARLVGDSGPEVSATIPMAAVGARTDLLSAEEHIAGAAN